MRKALVCLFVILAACGSGGGSGGATSHAVAACRANDDAIAAWQHYRQITSAPGGFTASQTAAAASDIATADDRMTSEAAKAAAADSKWDTMNRAMSTVSAQNRNGRDVDQSVDSTVDAECAKAKAS